MLSPEWLATFAPVGRLRGRDQWAAFGACVFFHRGSLLWLVTANHVVDLIGPGAVSVLVNRRGGGLIVVDVNALLSAHGISWVRDLGNDLAAAPMPASAEPMDIKAITAEVCLPLAQLVPSMPCYTAGCPYGMPGVDPQRATPLVLDGIISGVDPAAKRVYTSARTFPGNSGGPLIVAQTPFSNSGPDLSIAVKPLLVLAGVMLESALIKSNDPKESMPPLHMGIAAPTDAIIRLLDSDPARAIGARIPIMKS
jgi:hypothetical protein